MPALYYDSMMAIPEVGADPKAQVVRSDLEASTLEIAYSDALKNPATKIRSVARRIGIVSWFRIRVLLSQQDQPSDADFASVMDQLLRNVAVNDGAT